MSMELVPSQQNLQSLEFMAKNAHQSKFYQTLGGEAGIMSIMLLARELNVSPMMALSGGIWNIQGKVEMSARLMNMKIREAGHKMDIECSNTSCKIKGTRKDTGETNTVIFTIEDAQRAGLSTRDVWKKNPDDMLFARCLSKLARRLFPDVIGNCYVENEIRESLDDTKSNKKLEENTGKHIQKAPIIVEFEEIKCERPTEIKYINDEQQQQLSELFEKCPSFSEKSLKIYKSIDKIPDFKFEAAKLACIKAIAKEEASNEISSFTESDYESVSGG